MMTILLSGVLQFSNFDRGQVCFEFQPMVCGMSFHFFSILNSGDLNRGVLSNFGNGH